LRYAGDRPGAPDWNLLCDPWCSPSGSTVFQTQNRGRQPKFRPTAPQIRIPSGGDAQQLEELSLAHGIPPHGPWTFAAVKHRLELGARPRQAAAHRADGTAHDLRGFLVAQPVGTGEHEDLAMVWAELPEGARHVVELHDDLLRRRHRAVFAGCVAETLLQLAV